MCCSSAKKYQSFYFWPWLKTVFPLLTVERFQMKADLLVKITETSATFMNIAVSSHTADLCMFLWLVWVTQDCFPLSSWKSQAVLLPRRPRRTQQASDNHNLSPSLLLLLGQEIKQWIREKTWCGRVSSVVVVRSLTVRNLVSTNHKSNRSSLKTTTLILYWAW